MKSAGSDAGTAFLGGITGVVSTGSGSAAAAVAKAAAAQGETAGDEFADSASDSANTGSLFDGAVQNSSSDVVSEASDVGADTGTAMVDATAGSIERGSGSTKAAVRSNLLTGRIAAAVCQSAYRTIGTQLAQGMAAGVTNGTSYLTSAIRNIVNAGIEAGKAAAGINSPSKLFRDKIGQWIPKGMAEGITDNLSVVRDAAAGMIGAANISMPMYGGYSSPAMAALAGAGGQNFAITQNIYANSTSYAAQQRQAARSFRDIARRL